MALSFRLRASLSMVALAVAPVAGLALFALPRYGAAVREGEAQSQLLAVTQLVSDVAAALDDTRRDALAVAVALEAAAGLTDQAAAEGLVRRVAFRNEHVAAARFEVPAAGVDLVLNKPGADTSAVPRSTPELREEADARGVALAWASAEQAAMVVPVQPAEGGQRGYVTVPVYFKAFDQPLAVRIDNPDAGVAGAKVLLVSRDKKVIASHGDGLERGRDASSLAVMARAPDRMSRVDGHRFEVQTELSLDGVPSVATIATIPGVDWGLALWRPQSVAYARYEDVQRLAYGLGAVAVALALLAAFASARSIAAPVLRLVDKAKVIASRRWSEVPAPEARGDEIGELSQAMSDMAKDLETSEEEIRRQTKLRADLGRFVSADLVDAMVRGEHDLRLGGERRPISVLFADVVAFTPMAEQLPPETVVKLLNELFSVLTELVFQHEGMVDKFVGDCVMAVWGAPVPREDHARRALACAEDMMSFLEAGRDQWRDRYGVELRLAIGVNSGEAIVGNIGSDKRMEYTVVGDVVNVAARLESLAAPNQVLVAEGARALVGDEFELRRLGKKRLTGREKETEVYELTS